MSLGVYVLGEDVSCVEAVTLALEGSADLFVSPTLERADVVLASPAALGRARTPDAAAVVVLAAGDELEAARAAIARSAHGIVGWPQESSDLSVRLHEAAARRRGAGAPPGRLVSVVGARGGAGASTVAAYLARGLGGVLVDLAGGPAGQAIFAPEPAGPTLADLGPTLAELTPDAFVRALAPHAAGVRCLYGGPAPVREVGRLAAAAREAAPLTVVDGALVEADLVVTVIGPDVGSVRAAAGSAGGEIVLNRAGRDGVRARDAAAALGGDLVAVVPRDARIARATDLGRLVRRGRGARALARLARRVAASLENAKSERNEN